MTSKICKRCGLLNMEYYPRRNTCKNCCRAYQRHYHTKLVDPDAEVAVCGICNHSKPVDRFKISRKTKLLKDTCIDCKIPKGVNMNRYHQLNEWVDRIFRESKSEDIRILKHLFEKK